MRLELLQRLMRIVDEPKPGALSSTILRPEAEHHSLVLVAFVDFSQLRAEFVLGHVGAVGM